MSDIEIHKPKVNVTETAPPIPAPPSAMLDIMIMQLEGALDSVPMPDYVKGSATAFIESLKRWGREGSN
jgi:hypothetical protein